MRGIQQRTVVAQAVLTCDKCREGWASASYAPTRWDSQETACEPAWKLGWRVYAGARSQHTYCVSCAPTVPMRLVHGTERAR